MKKIPKRMTEEEYNALWDDKEKTGRLRPLKELKRMTEEEYEELWNGRPPKKGANHEILE